MSVGNNDIAVVSLGVSCQSSRQIRKQLETINEILDADLLFDRHFFDGLISPPKAITSLLEDGFPMFDRCDLAQNSGHAVWQPYGIQFLHHFQDEEGVVDIDQHFGKELERFTYLRNKFGKLKDVQRVVFVVSNSQNNIPDVLIDDDMNRVNFRDTNLEQLVSAVNSYFQRNCEFVFVSYPSRSCLGSATSFFALDEDESEWEGDKAQWKRVFLEYFSP